MTFIDSYEWISGWVHDYYCDRDGSLLIFDLHNSQYFECPVCHFKYTDIKRKGAWITKYRYKIFQLLEDYSKKYLECRDEEFLHFIEDALSYYSFNYEKFVLHNKEGKIFDTLPKTFNRCGRITAQGLNKAMLCIQIVHCIDNLYSYLNANLRESVFHLLFPQIYVLLKSQIHKIHNISCYEICSIAMMGILSSNKEMLEFAFSSRYSFYNQLDQGVTKDFLWFEGSFHYHFFVLKPILQLFKLAKKYQFYIPNKYYELVKKMLLEGYKMSFSDCSLPSPNDGWPNRYLSDYIEVFELGNQIFIDDFSVILKSIYARSNCYATTHCLDTGFSILKNKYWNVFIKYYENNISHAHPDKLNIEVKFGNNFLTHDLSTSGYGSTISSAFYKRTYSHNTIVIDGKDSNLSCNSIIHFYNENMIDVLVEDIYANINISRKIELLGKKWMTRYMSFIVVIKVWIIYFIVMQNLFLD